MNKIQQDELFGHVSQFLKAKGIELQEGSYTRTIQKGCQVLADTINLSQQAMTRAKSGLEKKLDQARQVIHEKTAPRKPPVQTKAGKAPASGDPAAKAKAPGKKTANVRRARKPNKPAR